MSPFVRWILAIVIALILLTVIVGFAMFGLLAMGFGSAGCDAIGEGASTFMLIASPVVMSLGVIAGAILFGLNKRWTWWVGALAGGGGLGILGYAVWFILVATVWCGS